VITKGKATYNGFWYAATLFPEMAKNVKFLIFVSRLPSTSETIATESLWKFVVLTQLCAELRDVLTRCLVCELYDSVLLFSLLPVCVGSTM